MANEKLVVSMSTVAFGIGSPNEPAQVNNGHEEREKYGCQGEKHERNRPQRNGKKRVPAKANKAEKGPCQNITRLRGSYSFQFGIDFLLAYFRFVHRFLVFVLLVVPGRGPLPMPGNKLRSRKNGLGHGVWFAIRFFWTRCGRWFQ